MSDPLQRIALLCLSACLIAGCDGGPSQSSALLYARSKLTTKADALTPGEALHKAETLRLAGADAEALALLAEAYRRFPKHGGVRSAYGRLALAMGHDELADGLLEAAVAADPGDWRALSARGVLEWRVGRQFEARGALVRARTASADDSAVLNNLGVSYLLDARTAEAIPLLRQALASPSLNRAHAGRIRRNLAVALAVDGNFSEADRLTQGKLPRSLENASADAIRRFMHVNDAPAHRRGAGWVPRLADAGRDWPEAR